MAVSPATGVRDLTDAQYLLSVRFEMTRWFTPYPDSRPLGSRTKWVALMSELTLTVLIMALSLATGDVQGLS
jgi:hypothetical protein